ncbi:MAG: hypothetical protein KDC90_18325, partial [Ignavibacteriae bacterium]|nr:hypothetical protein [Ignavibacteriota bacterium]
MMKKAWIIFFTISFFIFFKAVTLAKSAADIDLCRTLPEVENVTLGNDATVVINIDYPESLEINDEENMSKNKYELVYGVADNKFQDHVWIFSVAGNRLVGKMPAENINEIGMYKVGIQQKPNSRLGYNLTQDYSKEDFGELLTLDGTNKECVSTFYVLPKDMEIADKSCESLGLYEDSGYFTCENSSFESNWISHAGANCHVTDYSLLTNHVDCISGVIGNRSSSYSFCVPCGNQLSEGDNEALPGYGEDCSSNNKCKIVEGQSLICKNLESSSLCVFPPNT